MMKMMITDLTLHTITIAGTIVRRPSSIGPSQWMQKWEELIKRANPPAYGNEP